MLFVVLAVSFLLVDCMAVVLLGGGGELYLVCVCVCGPPQPLIMTDLLNLSCFSGEQRGEGGVGKTLGWGRGRVQKVGAALFGVLSHCVLVWL